MILTALESDSTQEKYVEPLSLCLCVCMCLTHMCTYVYIYIYVFVVFALNPCVVSFKPRQVQRPFNQTEPSNSSFTSLRCLGHDRVRYNEVIDL